MKEKYRKRRAVLISYFLVFLLISTNILADVFSFGINPKKFTIDLREEYVGEVLIKNPNSKEPITLIVSVEGEARGRKRNLKEEIEVYPNYLKVEPSSLGKVRFKYTPSEDAGSLYDYKANIYFKELPSKEKLKRAKNEVVIFNEIGISIYGR